MRPDNSLKLSTARSFLRVTFNFSDSYRNPSFSLAKFLVPILAPLTTNEFTVTNSYEFTECILSVDNADKCFMASFDVDSLFTHVPLRETIDICLGSLFVDPSRTIIGLGKAHFRTLIELTVLNSYFIFDGKLYQQTEGLGMGLPLRPTFANIFFVFQRKVVVR